MSDAAAKKAAENAAKREEEAREEAVFEKKQQKELAKRLKVVEQEKLVGPPCSYVTYNSSAVLCCAVLCCALLCRVVHVAEQADPLQHKATTSAWHAVYQVCC